MRWHAIAALIVLGQNRVASLVPLQLPSSRASATTAAATGGGPRIKQSSAADAPDAAVVVSRRAAFRAVFAAGAVIAAAANASPVRAMPMVTAAEFTTIVRDSARSIARVDFAGPRGETVVVRLVDGTTFGIKDAVESSTDPRSPLKIAALCNASKVPYKFVDIEALLAATPRTKKVYANARVLEAAEKQKEKAVRMQQDEDLRQEELQEMRRQ